MLYVFMYIHIVPATVPDNILYREMYGSLVIADLYPR